MFRVDALGADQDTPSHRVARGALVQGGTVLDIGCGGGRSSLSLAGVASRITGVDEHPEMLANFAQAADAAGVAHDEVLGRWPDIAGSVEAADVVLCHHVVYNVADLEPFVSALDDHAGRLVVVELPERHPMSPLNPLWEELWGLERPTEPSADLFIEVVRGLGREPIVKHIERATRKPAMSDADYIAFVRRRLCVGHDRDAEIAAALARLDLARPDSWQTTIVTVAWMPA
jgi:SAM-dependent methyltransferase